MTFNVLVVCTGNICRSPYIEYRLAQVASQAGVDLSVDSAGTQAANGTPYHPHTLELLRRHGIDASTGASRFLSAAVAKPYDVIIAAAEEHVQAVARTAPVTWKRCITLGQLAAMDPTAVIAGKAIAAQSEAKRTSQPGSYSIPDPMGQPLEAFEEMAAQVDALLPDAVRTLSVANDKLDRIDACEPLAHRPISDHHAATVPRQPDFVPPELGLS